MLSALRIRNLAIVDSLDVAFEPSLTVVTGETGAGKSILVHALLLLTGARASADLVRSGAERAEVEALFDLRDDPALRERLRSLELPDDDEIVVRRIVAAGGSGRSRASVNGALLTSAQLRALGAGLCDITSQHEHHGLSDPGTHLATLDAWVGRPDLMGAARARWEDAREARAAYEALRREVAELADRTDVLRFQRDELARLDPKAGELEALEAELGRLRNAGRISQLTARVDRALSGREGAVCAELARVEADLRGAAELDPTLGPLARQVASARIELDDAAHELARHARRVALDPGALGELEDRHAQLKRLARRHGSLERAIAVRAELDGQLERLDDAEHHLEARERAVAAALQSAAAAAEALSAVRRERAVALGRAIGAELADLGMGEAHVRVEVVPLPPPGGVPARGPEGSGEAELQVNGARLTARGMDRVELLIAPNRGEPPRALAKVASGGELSRALLAIKRVLAGLGPVGTYVFDEVDTGVGGAVADAIGRKLAEVARHHQVLCVTHLPQIAAFGSCHLHVSKAVEGDRTTSRVRRLPPEDRVEELARMLGGRTVTAAARSAARALLDAH